MNQGFFKVPRRGLECFPDDLNRKIPYTPREAYFDICASVRYTSSDETILINGKYIKIEQNQMTGAIRFLSNKWGWARGRTERFLKRLRDFNLIQTNIQQGITIITLVVDDLEGQQTGQSSGQQINASTPLNNCTSVVNSHANDPPNGTLTKTVPRQCRDTSETNKKKKEDVRGCKKKDISIPTPVEIESYCIEIGIPETDAAKEAEILHSRWTENKFTVSGKKIKNWKLVLKRWKLQGFLHYQKDENTRSINKQSNYTGSGSGNPKEYQSFGGR